MGDFLHIYAQAYNHGEAWICGDREALTRLRDTLTQALEANEVRALHSFSSDGEGYPIFVLPLDAETLEQKLRLPYRWLEQKESLEQVNDPEMKHPFQLIDREVYKRLMQGQLPCCGGSSYDERSVHKVTCSKFPP